MVFLSSPLDSKASRTWSIDLKKSLMREREPYLFPRLLRPLLLVCRWGQRFCEHHIAPRNSLSCTNWQRVTCSSSSACPTRSRMDCCSLHPLFFQLVFSLGASVLHGFRCSMLHMLRVHWIYIYPSSNGAAAHAACRHPQSLLLRQQSLVCMTTIPPRFLQPKYTKIVCIASS